MSLRIQASRSRSAFILGAVALLLLACCPPAQADFATYSLGTGNSAISGYPAPYGSVTVDLTDSTHATITFANDTVSGYEYLFGATGAIGINVNATSFNAPTTTAGFALTQDPGFSPASVTGTGSGSEDGFGTFNYSVALFDGYPHSVTGATFTITDTSGTWSSAADVLKANSGGYSVAAHIFVTSSPANANNTALATGYAANSQGPVVSSVPEPTSLTLWSLMGLAGLVYGRRRKRAGSPSTGV